jgi:hypothetical protein
MMAIVILPRPRACPSRGRGKRRIATGRKKIIDSAPSNDEGVCHSRNSLAMALTALADPVDSFEIGSPHFSTNTEIIWKAPTNHLPQSFWIYQRKLPHIFSEAVSRLTRFESVLGSNTCPA